ncbi:MAG: hypothetical protein HZC17_04615 [Candidatus Omnitrophica bacterium]|nr:hypothetical protein [Candidatus Omnitrophota bacterium]
MKRPLTFFLLLALPLAGCATVPREPLAPLKIQSATLAELAAKINTSAAELHTLKSTLDIHVRERGMTESRECQGLLAYEKPGKLYLKGYRALIPTFFTLTSKDGLFWVHTPKNNQVLTGKVNDLNHTENLEMGIRPDDLLKTLNMSPLPASDTYTVEMQEAPAQYIISVFRTDPTKTEKFLERQITVERFFLNVEQEVYFNAYGIAELVITRKNYANQGPVYFPRELTIFRPDRGSTLFLKARKLLINPALNQNLFDFQMPGGATVEELKKT